MRRWLAVLAGVALVAAAAEPAFAQEPRWPDIPFYRGGGFYLSWVKLACAWLVFLVWVATVDWINQDAQRHGLKYLRWNAIAVGPFVAAFLLVFVLPLFWLSLPLLVIAYAVPTVLYIRHRNALRDPHERVMTPDHLRFLLAQRLNAVGIKIISPERKSPHELGSDVTLSARGGASEQVDQANLIRARQSPGFLLARELLADAMMRRAESVMMDFTADAVAMRLEIDGVWHNGEARDRESGDLMLAVLKTISALNMNERRARQNGSFGAEHQKIRYTCKLTSQGTKTGERAVVQLDDGNVRFNKLADLGMRDKLQEPLLEATGQRQGLTIISAPPRGGLTSTLNATLGSADRWQRAFAAVEDDQRPERTIENIAVTTYNAAAGETPASVLTKVIRAYPDVIIVRELADQATATILLEQARQNRMVFTSVRAKESCEALLRVLALGVPAHHLAEAVTVVLNARLIRKLCEACKEAYAPTPQILQQLRIPAGKVEAFYRPPQQPEEVCETCGGIGFVGRTALFELLLVSDALRQVLAKTPKLDLLRQEARKGGMRTLQEEGILLVARGVTSLAELSRVLKE